MLQLPAGNVSAGVEAAAAAGGIDLNAYHFHFDDAGDGLSAAVAAAEQQQQQQQGTIVQTTKSSISLPTRLSSKGSSSPAPGYASGKDT